MFAQCVEQCRSIIQCEMNDVFVDLEGNLGFRLQYYHSLNGRAKEVPLALSFMTLDKSSCGPESSMKRRLRLSHFNG